MKQLYFLLLVCIIFGCKAPKQQMNLPEKSQIYGLASPIILGKDSTNIYLEDLFPDISIIDSVSLPQGFVGETQNNDKILIIKTLQENVRPINELKIWVKGFSYSIILRKSPKKDYLFSCQIDTTKFNRKPVSRKRNPLKTNKTKIFFAHSAKPIDVKLYGEMNNWDLKTAIPLIKKNNNFEVSLPLAAGKYAYRLLVNGEIITDPSNRDSVQNTKYGYNSVFTVLPINRKALPKLLTQSADNQGVTIETINAPDSIFVLWENFRLPIKIEHGLFQIKVPIQAGQIEHSYLRVFAYNSVGESNDLLIPLQNGKVISNSADLSKNDCHTNIFYFLPIERFLNGDTLSDVLPHNIIVPIPQKTINGKKKTVTKFITKMIVPTKSNNYSGDLVGVLNKLESGYFTGLGINTLWISPTIQKIVVPKPIVVKNSFGKKRLIIPQQQSSAASSFEMRIGNHLVLEQIIKEAHQQGLNVFLDIILDPNHQYDSKNPIKSAFLYRKDKKSKVKKMLIAVPQFVNTQPALIEAMTDSVVIWLKKFKLDGFRHDTTSFTNEAFARLLKQKIKKQIIIPEKRMICQIGENRNNGNLIDSQTSTLDLPLFLTARNTFASVSEPFSKIANTLQNTLDFFGNHHLLYNASETQEIPRFISFFTGVLTLTDEKSTTPYKKLLQLHAFYATIPGIPSVYFADEIGRTEANDHDMQHGMKFENLSSEEANVKVITEKLLKMRRSNMAILYGDFDLLQADDKTLAYSRSYFGKAIAVFYNKDNAEKNITVTLPKNIKIESLKAQFGSSVRIENQQLIITLAPDSFEILTN